MKWLDTAHPATPASTTYLWEKDETLTSLVSARGFPTKSQHSKWHQSMNYPWNFQWKFVGLPAFCMSQLESSLSEFPSNLGASSFHIVATGRPVWSNPVSSHIFTGLPHFHMENTNTKKISTTSSTRHPGFRCDRVAKCFQNFRFTGPHQWTNLFLW